MHELVIRIRIQKAWMHVVLILSPLTAKAKQYQECNTLVTRIEVRIMRLKREKGERIIDNRCVASHPRSQRT